MINRKYFASTIFAILLALIGAGCSKESNSTAESPQSERAIMTVKEVQSERDKQHELIQKIINMNGVHEGAKPK
jgi:hypothetical protein